jgi:ribosome recycling factor
LVNRRTEEARVGIRNLRRDALKTLTDQQKNGDISEDDSFQARDDLQHVTDEYTTKADELGDLKQAEIMEF